MRKFPVLLVTATVMPVVSMGGLGFERPGIDDIIGGGFTRIMPGFSNDVTGLPIGYSSFSSFSSSSSSPSSSSTPSSGADYFYSEKYGPFSTNNPSNVTASFTYALNSVTSQNVIERMRLYQGSSVVSSSSKALFYYEKGSRKTVSFDIPIKDCWTTNGLTIKIEILNSSYSILSTISRVSGRRYCRSLRYWRAVSHIFCRKGMDGGSICSRRRRCLPDFSSAISPTNSTARLAKLL